MTESRPTYFLKFKSTYRSSFALKCILAGLVSASLTGLLPNDAYAAGVVGNGTAASCTDAALKKALSGGGTVTFNCGGAAKTIALGSENVIAANTVIDGGNLITISGNNAKRLFNVQMLKSLTVKNLTLANGYTADQGAAIYSVYGTVVHVIHCNLTNNVSTKLGESGGGAIYAGAGTLVIESSKFSGNRASLGGAIRNLNSNLTVSKSVFTGNQAIDYNIGNGGAIYIDGAKGDNGFVKISESSFTSNTAKAYGGAVFNSVYNNNKTTIDKSHFITNSVGGGSNGQGGAFWSTGDAASGGHWVVNTNNTTLAITNSTFAGNVATTQGGAMWIARHPKGAVINNSTINGNKALSSMGGGIVQGETGKLSATNTTISDNMANGNYSMGGGVYVSRGGYATFTNTTIANNTAKWQAGGVYGATNVTLKNTILANNVALNGGNNWNIKHNCFQPMTNGGNNLQFPQPTDAACTPGMLIADPKLVALKNNGGPTLTRALSAGSAASQRATGCPATDQRGQKRANPVGTNCDIGAYEAAF